MAFLCPVRIRRNKKKKGGLSGYASEGEEKVVRSPGMGRITGSASIETLVRVGLEKEAGLSPDSKVVVVKDFTPCVDDELEVKRGSVVNVLYQENDWVYVISENGQHEGFIPHTYCAPYGSQLGDLALNQKKKIPRSQGDPGGGGGTCVDTDHNTTTGTSTSGATDNAVLIGSDNESYVGKGTSVLCNIESSLHASLQRNIGSFQNKLSDTSLRSGSRTPDIHPFFKESEGRYIVLYTFIARDENDVSVERGEFVTVLNKEDPDWFWVVRSDGQEGFVPSGFVYPADVIQEQLQPGGTPGMGMGTMGSPSPGGNAPQLLSSMNHSGGYIGSPQHHVGSIGNDENRYLGSEFIMLYDYKAQASDDLSVKRGDWIYADLSNQTVNGWLWVYSPKTRKYGFVPKAYARHPATTSL